MTVKTKYQKEKKIILNAIHYYKGEGDVEAVRELKQDLTDLKRSRHMKVKS